MNIMFDSTQDVNHCVGTEEVFIHFHQIFISLPTDRYFWVTIKTTDSIYKNKLNQDRSYLTLSIKRWCVRSCPALCISRSSL